MTPAARIAAMIEILADMQAASEAGNLLGRQAGQWLRAGLQRRRYAGSGDRAAVGDLFWKIQRGRARLGWHLASIGASANPRNITLAALVLMEQKSAVLPQLFSAPAPLDDNEAVLVAMLETRDFIDPAMPEHIALEWPEWLMADAKAGLGDGLARELATLMTEAQLRAWLIHLRGMKKRKQLIDFITTTAISANGALHFYYIEIRTVIQPTRQRSVVVRNQNRNTTLSRRSFSNVG